MKLTKSIVGFIVLFAIGLLVIGCGVQTAQQGTTTADSGELVFGFLEPLTGDVSFIGQQNLEAAKMAVEEINAAGGVNGRMLRLIAEDGKCDAGTAATAGSKLINVDGVKYIVGGGCSGETLAVAPLAERSQVIMMSPVSSNPDITNAGDYIFRNYVNDNDAGKITAQTMFQNGHRKVAMLYSLNDWANGVAAVFEAEFTRLGGQIAKESFVQGETDLRSIIGKVQASGADSVALFEYTQGAIAFFKQSEELGLDVPVYGADTLSDPDIAEGAGAAYNGARYVILKDGASQEFRAKMAQRTGGVELVPGSTNAYDAVMILARAVANAGDNTTAVKQWLYAMPPYAGETGSIQFDSNGDLASAQFSLYEIQNGKSVVIG
jgi:branched-chain amino acid transport system substrate-binding protein